MSLHHLLSRGHDPDRHRGTIVRRVRLEDHHEVDVTTAELVGRVDERVFVRHRQHDGVRPSRQRAGRRLSGGVGDLRGLDPSGQVRPRQDVVVKRLRRIRGVA